MNCLDFFEENKSDPEKCKKLQSIPMDKAISWEKEKASIHSPGIVEDEEIIIRQAFCPQHWDLDADKLKPSLVDDASNKGMSCDRLKHTDENNLNKKGKEREDELNKKEKEIESDKKTKYAFKKLVKFEVKTIREITNENLRGLGIYDTALKENVSHCDVCILQKGKQTSRRIRSKLFEAAKK